MTPRDNIAISILAVGSAGNLTVALAWSENWICGPLAILCGLGLAHEIRRFIATERDDALRFQRLLTESGHALHAPDFPALNAALKRHGVCLV